MLDGIHCGKGKGKEFVEYDGYYWKRIVQKGRWTTKYYYEQVFWKREPNELNESRLHRYIYAKFNGPIPRENEYGQKLIVHHKNEDELNNTIQNLDLITRGEHNRITRENLKLTNPDAYPSFKMSDEAKKKMSEIMKGRKKSKEAIAAAQEAKRKKRLDKIKAYIDMNSQS